MSPLVAKEIRLLLPAFGMALLLAILPAWIVPLSIYVNAHDFDSQTRGSDFAAIIVSLLVPPFGLGVVILALSSFGREFSLKTFSLVLAQPIERKRIWQTKIAMLVVATATLLTASALSCAVRIHTGSGWVIRDLFLLGGTTAIVALSSALWTTLLLRQIEAAVWIATLVPVAILMIIDLCGGQRAVMLAAMGVYAIFGFWLARWQFSRAQEIAWTGGVITLSGWRKAEAATQRASRARRPRAALFWKELQLHQMSLMGMAGLFALHLVVVCVRKIGHYPVGDQTRFSLDVFGGFWFIVPVVIASFSVAEERRLGTMQDLLCLPISSRIQFIIKLVLALFIGGFLSALLFWTAEGIGGVFGVGSDIVGSKVPFYGGALALLFLIFLVLVLIGFYASTLARGIVQALAAAIATAAVMGAIGMLISARWTIGSIPLWRGALVHYIAWPTLIMTGIWLASRNFRSMSENWVFWRRNLLGLAAALAFIAITSTAVYNRAWELFPSPEPAHGPARLAGPNRAEIQAYYGGDVLSALLPDGRLWVGRIRYDPGRALLNFTHKNEFGNFQTDAVSKGAHWQGFSGNHFVARSNWVAALANNHETIAIRSDGTLWFSEWSIDRNGPLPDAADSDLVRVGNGTQWKSLIWAFPSAVLLKEDGTLWQWGRDILGSGGRRGQRPDFGPTRLGRDSDWATIYSLSSFVGFYAWRKDGEAWIIYPRETRFTPNTNELELEPGGLVMNRFPELDHTKWRGMVGYFGNQQVGLREDGTLWHWNLSDQRRNGLRPGARKMERLGTDTNWVGVAGDAGSVGLIKADRSLWDWTLTSWQGDGQGNFSPAEPPVRLSVHNDWIAVGYSMFGIVGLAADGSLWHWWDRNLEKLGDPVLPLPAPSRKPSLVENILDDQK